MFAVVIALIIFELTVLTYLFIRRLNNGAALPIETDRIIAFIFLLIALFIPFVVKWLLMSVSNELIEWSVHIIGLLIGCTFAIRFVVDLIGVDLNNDDYSAGIAIIVPAVVEVTYYTLIAS